MDADQQSPAAPNGRASILAERLEHWMATDLAAVVAVLRRVDPVIPCGISDPDPRTEDRIAAARSDAGFSPAPGDGCGKLMVLWNAFRCVECGRWFHRTCIEHHFARHRMGG